MDDSAVFSAFLKKALEDNGFEVVGIASDPYQARDKILSLDPDVVTLDIEMPRMDGIHFLKRLLPQYPIPCVVVSSFTSKSQEAVDAGAAGFCPKPDISDKGAAKEFALRLVSAIRNAAAKKNAAPVTKISAPVPTSSNSANGIDIVALGASTGGTDALQTVITGLTESCPPVLVTQHMPPVFTKMYAERLDKVSALKVYEAEDGMRLSRGMCVIAAGGSHMRLKKDGGGYYITSKSGEKVSGHCPSVDVMFDSIADAAGGSVVAVLMTGMGADGAAGLLKLKKCGAYTIGQNKETCVVYGMPMEAYKLGAVCEEAPLNDISGIILRKLGINK